MSVKKLISLVCGTIFALAACGLAACAEDAPEIKEDNNSPQYFESYDYVNGGNDNQLSSAYLFGPYEDSVDYELTEYESLPYSAGKIQTGCASLFGFGTENVKIITSSDDLGFASDVYGDEFFENKALVAVRFMSSGSVYNIALSGIVVMDSQLFCVISANFPLVETDDIVEKVFTAEIDKDLIEGYTAGNYVECPNPGRGFYCPYLRGYEGILKESGNAPIAYRINGWGNWISSIGYKGLTDSEPIVIITSVEQFEKYDVQSLYTEDIYEKSIASRYTEEFFKDNVLILYEFRYESGIGHGYIYWGLAFIDDAFCPVVKESAYNKATMTAYLLGSMEMSKGDAENLRAGSFLILSGT